SLAALAQREGATPFMALLAAFQLLLSRYSGQGDISVGSPIAGRNRTETEGLIGFFVNTLVLRANVDDRQSFRELLAQVRQRTLAAYEHQDVPFEKLVEELQPQRSLSHSPLFQVMLTLQNMPQQAMELGRGQEGAAALKLSRLEAEGLTAQFDLTLSLAQTPRGLEGAFSYSTDLFDASTVARIAQNLGVLLRDVVARPDARLGDLSLLTGDEREQVLRQWNDTTRAYDSACLH
ncbi:condensation domain-containing protein, partial [Pyxidicoccus sp. 3LG]